MEKPETHGRPDPEPAGGAASADGAEPAEAQKPADGAEPADGPDAGASLVDFVPDPAVRAELARRMSELAGLVDEAGDALGEILQDVQRGFDSAERSRGVNRSST
ncbi:hypothetical protein ACFU9Y_19325 [Streptomyces sp. NPDC057621]|uniref:hypothetical protein n=1 Tax=Streptomyces sp. NPDC057621 TaxID=3346186 RepID=UPI00369608D9